MPDPKKDPLAVAQATRAYLMIRLAMHLGLRAKNLSQLLFTPRAGTPRGDRYLKEKRRGEFRWSERDRAWEVYIPSIAFKNWNSSFFRHAPYRAILPDLENLYFYVNEYAEKHRNVLLGGYDDPDTFFVRTLRSGRRSGEFTSGSFSSAWRRAIQLYGIFNPFTGRGAIQGLLPHGPNAIRDVIATHILKRSLSYELAAFALQDTVDTVRLHYCRFLPEEKSAVAAIVLNEVWQEVGLQAAHNFLVQTTS
jgi:hypothetical protein